jgi:hypothetical protein
MLDCINRFYMSVKELHQHGFAEIAFAGMVEEGG